MFLFFDKNADALLLHTFIRDAKGFVWRQLEWCVFYVSTPVGAFFIFQRWKTTKKESLSHVAVDKKVIHTL